MLQVIFAVPMHAPAVLLFCVGFAISCIRSGIFCWGVIVYMSLRLFRLDSGRGWSLASRIHCGSVRVWGVTVQAQCLLCVLITVMAVHSAAWLASIHAHGIFV